MYSLTFNIMGYRLKDISEYFNQKQILAFILANTFPNIEYITIPGVEAGHETEGHQIVD